MDPLKIEVAPDIVEILGLNLYTNLARVLVEFIANAFDADSPDVAITFDADRIRTARQLIRAQAGASDDPSKLDALTLPPELTIVVEDHGHGMTRDELQRKFLRIGRKRRKAEGQARSPGNRPVMGRKGIGKLAGFGVAKRVEVVTKPLGQSHAVRIALDYDKLVGHETTAEVPVEEAAIDDGAGLHPSGTRVILSLLTYGPTGVRFDTIARLISEHFSIVKPAEFAILLNGSPVDPFTRDYAFAYPEPERAVDELLPAKLDIEGTSFRYSYRIRFTRPKHQLQASERGVRIYARQRLALPPSLLDLKTGIHGFQNSHYLDGEVRADFIDDQEADYIASDRQDLRWETPVLNELRNVLTEAMEQGCIQYQGTKENTLAERVRQDPFTRSTISQADLPVHRREMAYRIAVKLASGCPDETQDSYYIETLPVITRGLGYGELMTSINKIAAADHPSLREVVSALAELTAAEWDENSKIIAARLKGIAALQKLCQDRDFKDSNNEDQLHALLKANPWLIDGTFWSFLTSNVAEKTLSAELSKALQVDEHVPLGYDKTDPKETEPGGSNRRPDLVFLLGNYALQRVVIVELKAPNTPLHSEHLDQLEGYMERAEEWLTAKGLQLKVEGYLIGSRDAARSRANGVVLLRRRERNAGPSTDWRIFDLAELLKRAVEAHKEMLDVYQRASCSI